ncbi:MAG: ParB/RepB/Spo0J family partition protein [Anaerorhabdus sp.]
MSEKNKKLGKGLSSIFGDDLNDVIEDIQHGRSEYGKANEISVSEIRANPYQPRVNFDVDALNELSDSIKEHGVFTPILVRKSLQGYEIIAGERRWRATKKAKLKTIPAMVVEFSDEQMMEVSILENVQRENLNPIEEAMAYHNLAKRLNYTQDTVAQRLGKSRVYVANMTRLLKLPEVIQKMVIDKKISMGHARCLISLSEDDAVYIAEMVVSDNLSVRETENLVKRYNNEDKKASKKVIEKNPHLISVENYMKSKLQTSVIIENGKIQISYSGDDDLNRILEIIGCIEE